MLSTGTYNSLLWFQDPQKKGVLLMNEGDPQGYGGGRMKLEL